MNFERRHLGEFAKIFIGVPTKRSDTSGAGRTSRVLTVRSLTGAAINPIEAEHLHLKVRSMEKYTVQAGDLLIPARSTSLKAGIVPDSLGNSVINATLIGIRCLPAMLPQVLAAYFLSLDGQAAIEGISQSGTGQMNVTVSGLSSLVIPVPPIDLQRRLASILDAAEQGYCSAIKAAEDRISLAREITYETMTRTASTDRS